MGRTRKIAEMIVPMEAQAMILMAKRMKGQGSLEYIMMIAAASIVIVLALVMVVKLRSSVPTSVIVNGTNTSVSSAISSQLGKLANNIV